MYTVLVLFYDSPGKQCTQKSRGHIFISENHEKCCNSNNCPPTIIVLKDLKIQSLLILVVQVTEKTFQEIYIDVGMAN